MSLWHGWGEGDERYDDAHHITSHLFPGFLPFVVLPVCTYSHGKGGRGRERERERKCERGGGEGERGGRDEERVRGREAAETESSKPQTVIFGFPFGELPFISFVFQDTPVPGGRAGASVLGSYCPSVSAGTAHSTTDCTLY